MQPHGHNHLNDRDRQALRLAHDLRERMKEWMSRRGVTGTLIVTPFVDRSGEPSVLVRMNSYLAHAIMLNFEEHRAQLAPQRRDNGTFHR